MGDALGISRRSFCAGLAALPVVPLAPSLAKAEETSTAGMTTGIIIDNDAIKVTVSEFSFDRDYQTDYVYGFDARMVVENKGAKKIYFEGRCISIDGGAIPGTVWEAVNPGESEEAYFSSYSDSFKGWNVAEPSLVEVMLFAYEADDSSAFIVEPTFYRVYSSGADNLVSYEPQESDVKIVDDAGVRVFITNVAPNESGSRLTASIVAENDTENVITLKGQWVSLNGLFCEPDNTRDLEISIAPGKKAMRISEWSSQCLENHGLTVQDVTDATVTLWVSDADFDIYDGIQRGLYANDAFTVSVDSFL